MLNAVENLIVEAVGRLEAKERQKAEILPTMLSVNLKLLVVSDAFPMYVRGFA